MKRSSFVTTVVILMAAIGLCAAGPALAQCSPTCKGDFNQDGEVSIDELVTAVNNALGGCEASPEEEGCIASGGVVTTQFCYCASAPDFPDTCGIGGCTCSPDDSRALPFCHCDPGYCFDRSQKACVVNQ